MTREIKFRAWVNKEEMVYLYDWGFEEEKSHIIFYSPIRMKGSVELMQYTGLKDKNGKEIYEGDILKQDIRNEFGSLSTGKIGQMVWREHGMWTIKFEDESPINFEGTCPPPEIIGNIYENPELLQSAKENIK